MALPRPVKAVVFDMDGLLVDSEVAYREAAMAAAEEMGVELSAEFYHRTIGRPWPGVADLLREEFGSAFDTERLRQISAGRFAKAQVRLKTGVLEVLDHLDERGLPRAIASSSSRQSVLGHMTAHGILQRFHAVVAHGDYMRGKPHPDPFLAAAGRLGVAPQDCLALEDSHNGVRAAAAAGMMTVMAPDLLEATEEMRSLCVRVVRDLHEVRALLERQPRIAVLRG